MIGNKRILAIIPARAGSKRLPNKNILPLNGKPLIAWSIEAATLSRYIDTVIVSTDSDSIMKIAAQFGAGTPFQRPPELASDTASSSAVMLHCLEYMASQREHYDIVILLQPTSPLRNVKHVDEAIEFFTEKNANGVVSVCECEHSPLWSNTLPEDANLGAFIRPEVKNCRSQDLPTFYRLNGAIYVFAMDEFILQQGTFYNDQVYAYIMDQTTSIDIDTALDFKLAEFLQQSTN